MIVEEMDAGILSPRLTDEFGRYRRLLYVDSFNLTFKKAGYEEIIYQGVVPSADIVTELDIAMNPKNNYILTINMNVPSTHSDSIVFYLSSDVYQDAFVYSDSSSDVIFSIPSGDYTLKIISDDILPLIKNFYLDQDMELESSLYWYDVIFQDNFDNLDPLPAAKIYPYMIHYFGTIAGLMAFLESRVLNAFSKPFTEK